MPILHRYRSHSGYYVKTSIRGVIITYQLTPAGASRLLQAGITDSERFSRNLLVDLVQGREAYTHGSGVDAPEEDGGRQASFDLEGEEATENLFPKCGEDRSYLDLHLIALGSGESVDVKLLCVTCREAIAGKVQLNIPLAILDLRTLKNLETLKKIPSGNDVINSLHQWFSADMSAAWEKLYKQKGIRQEALPIDNPGSLF